MDWTWFHKFGSPPHVYRLAGLLTPGFAWPAALLILGALYGGLVLAPPDYQQGDGFRIIYVHAPSAWLAVMIYAVMATAAGVGLIWRMKVAHAVAASCAGVGAWFTVVSLLTGMLWGKPMWGTWWVWDARLTSTLILLFLYLGTLALWSAIEDTRRGDRAGALLTLFGVVNVPIITFSVVWWNTLHQGSSIGVTHAPRMATVMMAGVLTMTAAAWAYAIAVTLARARRIILERERKTEWVQRILAQEA